MAVSNQSFDTWIAPFYRLRPSPGRGDKRFQSFEELCNKLFPAALKIPAIHIAGTNGKGSVGLMIADSLNRSGYRVGRFSSPHLVHFSERIEVNRSLILEKEVKEMGEKVFQKSKELGFSIGFFEWSFLIALKYFSQKQIDVMVVEAGIGGQLDSTNVVQHTIASIIVSVSLDHTEILGATVEEITRDKMGILRPKVPAIFGPSVPALADEKARSLRSPCFRIENMKSYNNENRSVAKSALEAISDKFQVKPEALSKGLLAKLLGRRQVILDRYFFDVAHNVGGVRSLLASLSSTNWKKAPLFVGFRKDKRLSECLKEAGRYSEEIFFVQFDHPLCPTMSEIMESSSRLGVQFKAIYSSAKEALEDQERLGYQKCVFIGSFHFIGSALTFLDKASFRS